MDSCNTENLLEYYSPINVNDTYAKNNNIRMVSITDEGGLGEMYLGPELSNENLDVHGGALYTLADIVAASAAYVWGVRHWGPNISYTTATASFSYMRPIHLVNGGDKRKVLCRSILRKTGRTLAVIDVCLTDEEGTELCRGTFTGCYIDMERYRKPKRCDDCPKQEEC